MNPGPDLLPGPPYGSNWGHKIVDFVSYLLLLLQVLKVFTPCPQLMGKTGVKNTDLSFWLLSPLLLLCAIYRESKKLVKFNPAPPYGSNLGNKITNFVLFCFYLLYYCF